MLHTDIRRIVNLLGVIMLILTAVFTWMRF
jgi:hypothetical protein